jgi:hypothetical protein
MTGYVLWWLLEYAFSLLPIIYIFLVKDFTFPRLGRSKCDNWRLQSYCLTVYRNVTRCEVLETCSLRLASFGMRCCVAEHAVPCSEHLMTLQSSLTPGRMAQCHISYGLSLHLHRTYCLCLHANLLWRQMQYVALKHSSTWCNNYYWGKTWLNTGCPKSCFPKITLPYQRTLLKTSTMEIQDVCCTWTIIWTISIAPYVTFCWWMIVKKAMFPCNVSKILAKQLLGHTALP